MFCAFIGDQGCEPAWRACSQKHADGSGLAFHSQAWPMADGHGLAFGWLAPPAAARPEYAEVDGQLRLQTNPCVPLASAEGDDNLIRVELALPAGEAHAGEVQVTVPLGTPEPFYYALDRRGWVLGTDLRLITRWLGAEPDERGLFARLQYGAISAPLTPARGVRRVPNGHSLCIPAGASQPKIRREGLGTSAQTDPDPEGAADPAERVARALDELLTRTAPSSLYFSGGVDSSLLAARLLALGFSGVRLINFTFGPDDPEGQHAQRVAAHLGLACEQISYHPEDVVPMLQRIGRDYSFPFVDQSVIPANLRVTASLDLIGGSPVVLEGTGADGAFGSWSAYSRVAHLPRPARQALAAGYGWLGLWQRPTELERVARLARQLPAELIERTKSGIIPPMPAILARPDVQAFVHAELLRPANPVLALCNQRVAGQMLARAGKNQPLASGAYRFLWAVIFASCWLEQSRR